MRDLIDLAENLFAKPDAHRRVSFFEHLHLLPADRDAALCLATLHDLRKLGLQASALDGACRDIEESANLLVRALQLAKLLQIVEIYVNPRAPFCQAPTSGLSSC